MTYYGNVGKRAVRGVVSRPAANGIAAVCLLLGPRGHLLLPARAPALSFLRVSAIDCGHRPKTQKKS